MAWVWPVTSSRDAADRAIEALAGYRGGGVEHLSEDLVEYVRNQPMTALLLATGVGIFVGMVTVLAPRSRAQATRGPRLVRSERNPCNAAYALTSA